MGNVITNDLAQSDPIKRRALYLNIVLVWQKQKFFRKLETLNLLLQLTTVTVCIMYCFKKQAKNYLENICFEMNIISISQSCCSLTSWKKFKCEGIEFLVSGRSAENCQKSLTSKTSFMVKVIPFDGLLLFFKNWEVLKF